MEYYTGRRINVRAIIYKDGKLLAVKHKHGDNISHYSFTWPLSMPIFSATAAPFRGSRRARPDSPARMWTR